MALEPTQQTFMGASIQTFSCNMGWGGSASTLTVQVVEDDRQSDEFTPVDIGEPAYFTFSEFSFNGILQSWNRDNSAGGNPVYEIILNDPRDILDGVQIILDSYTGSTYGVNNLINVYGYISNVVGLASIFINESGLPWREVAEAIVELINGPDSIYGERISFGNSTYLINLNALPNVGVAYRVSGNISLLGFIDDICSTASYDYFFDMYLDENGNNVIRLNTISKGYVPQFGAIDRFVSGMAGAESKRVGYELRNEPTSKFLLGGNQHRLYGVTRGSTGNGLVDSIWPFWGINSSNNLIVGQGVDNEHTIYLEAKTWGVQGLRVGQGGAYYGMDIAEMRAANNQASWESFMWSRNPDATTPQYQIAGRVGIMSSDLLTIKEFLNANVREVNDIQTLTPLQLSNLIANAVNDAGNYESGSDIEQNTSRLYDIVRQYATEYYGRKFYVRVDDLSVTLDSTTLQPNQSHEISDGGYIDETEIGGAIQNGLLPQNYEKFALPDGRISAYAKFTDGVQYDFNDVPEEAIALNGNDVYVQCNVDTNLYYMDEENFTNPRVLITLPGPVRARDADDKVQYDGVIFQIMKAHLLGIDPLITDEDLNENLNILMQRPGADNLLAAYDAAAILPDFVAIPLQSNTETYGPWYSTGANGKLIFEKDDSLVPWNYGTYATMNSAANAKVDTIAYTNYVSEAGSIKFPGTPINNLGSQLNEGGPYVTGINVVISEGDISTTYDMNTWTPQFGKLAKVFSDILGNKGRNRSQLLREARDLAVNSIVDKKTGQSVFTSKTKALVNRVRRDSSSMIILGEVHTDANGVPCTTVAIQPQYRTLTQLRENYGTKAGGSFDTLFRPFTTDTTQTNMGHFEDPEENADSPTVDELNPYGDDHDFQVIISGTEMPATLYGQSEEEIYRGIALRGPVVISGWGYDSDGYPVPNNTPTEPGEQFLENYRKRPDKWKTGPLDVRWNDDRKVWVAGGGNEIKIVKIVNPGGVYSDSIQNDEAQPFRPRVFLATVWNISVSEAEMTIGGEVSLVATTEQIYVATFRHATLATNVPYLAIKINGIWLVDNPLSLSIS